MQVEKQRSGDVSETKVRVCLPMEQQVNCIPCQMAYTTLFCQSVGVWL